jgi:hypothetical protein
LWLVSTCHQIATVSLGKASVRAGPWLDRSAVCPRPIVAAVVLAERRSTMLAYRSKRVLCRIVQASRGLASGANLNGLHTQATKINGCDTRCPLS